MIGRKKDRYLKQTVGRGRGWVDDSRKSGHSITIFHLRKQAVDWNLAGVFCRGQAHSKYLAAEKRPLKILHYIKVKNVEILNCWNIFAFNILIFTILGVTSINIQGYHLEFFSCRLYFFPYTFAFRGRTFGAWQDCICSVIAPDRNCSRQRCLVSVWRDSGTGFHRLFEF